MADNVVSQPGKVGANVVTLPPAAVTDAIRGRWSIFCQQSPHLWFDAQGSGILLRMRIKRKMSRSTSSKKEGHQEFPTLAKNTFSKIHFKKKQDQTGGGRPGVCDTCCDAPLWGPRPARRHFPADNCKTWGENNIYKNNDDADAWSADEEEQSLGCDSAYLIALHCQIWASQQCNAMQCTTYCFHWDQFTNICREKLLHSAHH